MASRINTTGWDGEEELQRVRQELRSAHAEIARLRALVPPSRASEGALWLFGYGSLMWNAGSIPFDERRAVYVRVSPASRVWEAVVHSQAQGFIRRFWQRSTDHRGTIEV